MADFQAACTALAATIQANTTPSLTCYGQYRSQINPPMAYVVPQPGQLIVFDTLDLGGTGVGAVTYHVRVPMFVSYAEDESSTALLNSYLSTNEPGSVINAIMLNDRLGGVVDFAVVTTAHSYGLRTVGDQQYLACDLLVSIAASTP